MSPQSETLVHPIEALVMSMPAAQTLQLRFIRIEPGEVELTLPYQDSLSFRPGQLQATPIFAAADFAAVSAAGTLLPPGWVNATIDCTLKIVGPANGTMLRARGYVIDAGKLMTVAEARVYSCRDGEETLCATLLATARNLPGRPESKPA
ncbi:PaaI family thioesterase [Burkholderia sp. FERM BP-3421]|jgi:acyl-coenzyme A thioesterase PaaI-like protein|uniref:PaaI family thioesterase n=1 Tax=Burkholderia sp. FERM BP-3421 TaxID=1494466 RepID=UPI0023631345|nr:PaaI family thioesterase [Burkholderia sp. FERM BP-3421]WDD92377.1 PaaI family thioesterase [Burkholderia sp. FERM BP-3421]